MFQAPFSFEGRIRRTEYGISCIIYSILYFIVMLLAAGTHISLLLLYLILLSLLWFQWAQSTKRCHDLGKSGWWQIIPFYGFWLLFEAGKKGPNKYGDDPKLKTTSLNATQPNLQQTSPPSGNSGFGYQGGHNSGFNPSENSNPPKNRNTSNNNSGEYQSGNLYS